MNNASIETLRKTLVKVLDMPEFSDMPIGTKYYVLRDVFSETENQYFKAIEQELKQSREEALVTENTEKQAAKEQLKRRFKNWPQEVTDMGDTNDNCIDMEVSGGGREDGIMAESVQ